ncbi:Fpg/Nei family DNA glycosylase [Streptacidiphilus fuscans]|uniref:DNA-(apurinic or apyrimidinic site) lyase n=1 Tax=Streptacidiphilus fuscans TaxID=2789292 RepID=A0A931BA12_9ACTN|nr:Fpg/Nei family DNA glycosylase [Streptacidiphilus fuscans]MBF9069630.1 Fpg/Nei family DNA glycosylase [Streptacidiphilus fuscans]
MPEGDSVFLAAKQLHDALAGQSLTVSDLRVPAHATADLTGRQVLDVTPRGKHLLSRIEGGLTLHTHLRMEGRWRVFPTGAPWHGGASSQIRAVLGNATSTAVGYRLGIVELLPTAAEPRIVGHLGPDLLGPDWDPAEAVRRLTADPRRGFAEALLDQRNLAGIGNVYANELCFMAGVSPWTPVADVAELDRVVRLAHHLLTVNRLQHAHVTTGDPRPDRQNWVYGRTHKPCRRCGRPIRTGRLGTPPKDRTAFWCPRCQPRPQT